MSNVYFYVVNYDLGFAPNPFDGVCTLACCMPTVRRTARLGDWIVGMGGRALKATGSCIYAMRVDGDLSFDQYWASERFRGKRPARNGSRKKMVGDNIYHRDPATGLWLQENSVHSRLDGGQDALNTRHDTQTDRILFSDKFFYFGASAPAVPPAMLKQIGFKNGRGHRKYDLKKCGSFLAWVEKQGGGHPNLLRCDPFEFRKSDKRYDKKRNKLI